MDGNSNLIEFLQRAVGYSLSGDITEQCFFLLYGSGANGKSVPLEILRSLLGDYATDSPFSAFEYRYTKSNSNDLARLSSARLVTSAIGSRSPARAITDRFVHFGTSFASRAQLRAVRLLLS